MTKSTLLFSKRIILVEGISEAMLIPSFAKIVLAELNKSALILPDNDPPKEKIEVLDEKEEPALNQHGKPIVDLQEVYPTPSKLLKGANSALELEDDKQKIVWGRLYSFPLKTFEYDLLMEGNISKMAEVLQKFWLTDKGV